MVIRIAGSGSVTGVWLGHSDIDLMDLTVRKYCSSAGVADEIALVVGVNNVANNVAVVAYVTGRLGSGEVLRMA